ncbi:hypothetical protein WK28_12825 [Burkholderia vietnamiensis]|nr:hypothetical protein WK28_12825 [Burkholderia vietnamiensis]
MTDCPRIASSPAMCVASVVLPTPPFWLSRATIMARPSVSESPAVAAAFLAARCLSTVARRFYYQLEN